MDRFLHVFNTPSDETVLIAASPDRVASFSSMGSALMSGVVTAISRDHLNRIISMKNHPTRTWSDIIIHV